MQDCLQKTCAFSWELVGNVGLLKGHAVTNIEKCCCRELLIFLVRLFGTCEPQSGDRTVIEFWGFLSGTNWHLTMSRVWKMSFYYRWLLFRVDFNFPEGFLMFSLRQKRPFCCVQKCGSKQCPGRSALAGLCGLPGNLRQRPKSFPTGSGALGEDADDHSSRGAQHGLRSKRAQNYGWNHHEFSMGELSIFYDFYGNYGWNHHF